MARCLTGAALLVVAAAGHEGDVLGVDLDQRAVAVLAHRHKRAGDAAGERIGAPAHQFGQDLGNMLRVVRGNRYVMDHRKAPPQ
jgi:hypothetical protein